MTRLIAALTLLAALCATPAQAATAHPLWPHQSHHLPTLVLVQDETHGHAWGVRAAVAELGFAGLRLGTCREGVGCIRVHGNRQGYNHGWVGTDWPHTRGGQLSAVGVYLNWTLGKGDTADQRRQASVSELVHALGLKRSIAGTAVEYRDTGRYPNTAGLYRPLRALYKED